MRYGSMLYFAAGLSFTLVLHLTACAQTSAQKPMYQTIQTTTPRDDEGYWTPERMRKAQPMPMPSVSDGRNPHTPTDEVREYQPPADEDYWTPERMRKARPMPMPSIPDERPPRTSTDEVREYQPPADEDYWTPERMRKARPMPMPSIPDGRNPRIPN